MITQAAMLWTDVSTTKDTRTEETSEEGILIIPAKEDKELW